MRKLIVLMVAPLLLAIASCKKDDKGGDGGETGATKEIILGKWRLLSIKGINVGGTTVNREVFDDKPSYWTFGKNERVSIDGLYHFFEDKYEGLKADVPYKISGDLLIMTPATGGKDESVSPTITELTADRLVIGFGTGKGGSLDGSGIGVWHTFRKM